jgi:hypothetical protein
MARSRQASSARHGRDRDQTRHHWQPLAGQLIPLLPMLATNEVARREDAGEGEDVSDGAR